MEDAMRAAKAISESEIEALEAKARKIKGRLEYRRLQSVLLRAREHKTHEEIGKILEIHPRTVQKHQARYLKEGMAAFESKKPGRKGPEILTAEQEKELFEQLKEQAGKGELVNICVIQLEFETRAGRPCSTRTIYRAIHRNKWSKKHPRPRHPKGDEEAKRLFKKITAESTVDC